MIPYKMVENNADLAALCKLLMDEQEIAFDLEADSLHHYQEKVSLLQLSNRKSTWLVDPLKVNNFKPLSQLLSVAQQLVVFHGGDYDIRSLHRDFEITVANVFDTMIAAQFAGYTEFGLAALLHELFGVKLDKKYQKADWSKRPLADEMAEYAANDTAHLLQLADILRAKLTTLGRLDWVLEESALLAGNRAVEKNKEQLFLHFRGAGKLKSRNLAALECLLQFRDKRAKKMDKPPFKVLPNDALMTIAQALPKSKAELDAISVIPAKLLERYGKELVQQVLQAMEIPNDRLQVFPRKGQIMEAAVKKRLAKLKNWREQFSVKLQLAPGLVAPNWLLERIAVKVPTTLSELSEITGIRNWQQNLWGAEVVDIMATKTATEQVVV